MYSRDGYVTDTGMNTIALKCLLEKFLKHKSTQNFTIIAAIAVVQLFNNVILGRSLSKDEFGLFSFVFFNVVNFLSVLLLFGQNSSILRYFSSKNIQHYKWKQYLLSFFALIIVPVVLSAFAIKHIYKLEWTWFLMAVLASFMMCCTNMTSTFYRSQGYFNTAIILERGHPVFFIILLAVSLVLYNTVTIGFAAVAKLISFSVQLVVIVYMFSHWKEGGERIEKSVFSEGITLWELSLSVIVLTSIDAFFIAKILDYRELALYSVMIAVMQIYEFSRISLFQVYSQKFSRSKNINIPEFVSLLAVVAVMVTLFYLFSTKFIVRILFGGKYDASFALVVLFCCYGVMNLMYVLPSCYLVGQSSKKEMHYMLGVNILSIVIKVVLIFALKSYALSGFLVAGIVSQFFRTGAGYVMVFKNKKIDYQALARYARPKIFKSDYR